MKAGAVYLDCEARAFRSAQLVHADLPAPGVLVDLGRRHELAVAGERVFGQDYVHTLRDWASVSDPAWPSIEQMGFDERFRCLWEYYLAYSEAGFRSGIIDVRQMVFARQS